MENLRPNRFRKECHLNFFDKTANPSYNRTETVGTLPVIPLTETSSVCASQVLPCPRLSVPTFPGQLQSPDLPHSEPEHLDELPQSSTNSGVSKQKNLDFNYKQELFKISTLSRNEKCFSHIRQREWTPMVSVKPKIEEHPYPSLPSVGWGPAQKQMVWLFLCLESSTHSARAMGTAGRRDKYRLSIDPLLLKAFPFQGTWNAWWGSKDTHPYVFCTDRWN